MAKESNTPTPLAEEQHFDDQLNDELYQYLRDNRRFITVIVLVLVGGATLFLGTKYFRQQKLVEMRSAFSEAAHSGDFEAFFDAYESTPLASVAGLREAREALDSGEYETAARLYEKIEAGLTRTPLQGLGQIGRGTAIARSGDLAFAESAFRLVLEDDKAYETVRALAAFQIGLIGIQSDSPALVEEAETLLATLFGGESYLERLRTLSGWQPAPLTTAATDAGSESAPEAESPSTTEAESPSAPMEGQ